MLICRKQSKILELRVKIQPLNHFHTLDFSFEAAGNFTQKEKVGNFLQRLSISSQFVQNLSRVNIVTTYNKIVVDQTSKSGTGRTL